MKTVNTDLDFDGDPSDAHVNAYSPISEAKAKGWDESAFATATAIVYLEQKLADLKESWELVVTKAKKWLEKNFSTQSAEILAGASTFMSAFV